MYVVQCKKSMSLKMSSQTLQTGTITASPPLIQILSVCVLLIFIMLCHKFQVSHLAFILAAAFRTIGKCFNRIGSN